METWQFSMIKWNFLKGWIRKGILSKYQEGHLTEEVFLEIMAAIITLVRPKRRTGCLLCQLSKTPISDQEKVQISNNHNSKIIMWELIRLFQIIRVQQIHLWMYLGRKKVFRYVWTQKWQRLWSHWPQKIQIKVHQNREVDESWQIQVQNTKKDSERHSIQQNLL